jgi:hypothetical protein
VNSPPERGAWLIPATGLGLAGLLALTEATLGVGYPKPYSPPEAPLIAAAWGLPTGMLVTEALFDLRTYKLGRKGLFLALGLILIAAGTLLPWPISVPPSVHGAVVGFAVLHELIDYRPTSSLRLLLVGVSLSLAAWHELLRFEAPASLLVGLGVGIAAWCVARISAGAMR